MTQTIDAAQGAQLAPEQGEPSTRPGRQALADDLLDELTAWSPRDREGMFRSWHRGALSLIHLNVLAVLEAEGPQSMRQLAQSLDVSDASATGIVDRMERRGLVERRHATDDRRLVLVHLTSAGSAVFTGLRELRRARLSRVFEELSEEELGSFLVGLRAMRAAQARVRAAEGRTAFPFGADNCFPPNDAIASDSDVPEEPTPSTS